MTFFLPPKQLQLLDKVGQMLIIGLALIIGLITIYALTDFNSLFINFHKLFFASNNYWQLDPQTSNLIKFLPEQIFQELAWLWFAISVALSIIWFCISKYRGQDMVPSNAPTQD